MAIRIPGQSKRFSLPLNYSDVLGNIYSSFNVDFTSNIGKLRLGSRILLNTKTGDTDATNLGLPIGFKFFTSAGSNYIWTAAGARLHRNTGTISPNFTQDTTTDTPTDLSSSYSDIELFNNFLFVSGNSNKLYYLKATGTWQNLTVSGSGSSQPHMLCVYGDRLYYSYAGNQILSYDSASTPSAATAGQTYTLSLPDGSDHSFITCMRAGSNRIWIATLDIAGGKGRVFEWDGAATQVTKRYMLESAGAVAMVIKDDIPWIMDTNGALCVWNGGYFKEVARLNINRKILKGAYLNTNLRYIHPNGMTVVSGKINILINNEVLDDSGSIEEFCPSGVYEYDPEIGLYHKGSVSYLTSAGTVADYSQIRISQPGALTEMRPPLSTSPGNGILLIGCTYYTDATTTTHGIFYDDTNDTKAKTGYFITPKIYSDGVQDAWQKIWIKYKKLLDSTDRIIVKYRITDPSPSEFTGTWTSTTTFTTTSSSVAGKTGYEVEVISGNGGGATAHISSISLNGSTYTVTIDTAIGSASGTAKIRIQNWTKLFTVSDQVSSQDGKMVGEKSNWVQFKVVMYFTGKDEVEEVIISNENFLPIT